MSRPLKGRVDKLAPDKISTEQVIDELKSKIQLAGNSRTLLINVTSQSDWMDITFNLILS